MSAQAAAKAKKPQIHENSLERSHVDTKSVNSSLSAVSNDVLSNLWNELITGGTKDLGAQIFGASKDSSASHAAEMYPGKIIDLQKKREEKRVARSEAHMEYFREIKNVDIAPEKRLEAAAEQRVEQIRMEIKALLKQSKELQTMFKTVQIEQKVVKAGKYHETLLSFVLSLLRSARVKMQEGASWMSVLQSKKKQKQYQAQAKKHGTSFTLNNERTVATQTG